MCKYLIDANVIITAERDYYTRKRIPQYWDWLIAKSKEERIIFPKMILEEVTTGAVSDWLNEPNIKETLVSDNVVDGKLIAEILADHYGIELSEEELKSIGNDPYLIGEAVEREHENVVVVTKEISKPSAKREKRKIPDICSDLSIKCIDDFQLYRDLDFSLVGYQAS